MDPLSIASAALAIIGNIINLSKQISSFVSTARDARSDMEVVNRELSSLTYALQLLKDDFSLFDCPESLRRNLDDILRNCNQVLQQMQQLLAKFSPNKLGRKLKWAFDGRDEMSRLRSSLEAHKSAINISLEVGTLFLNSSIKQDTNEIRSDVAVMKHDTSQIAAIKEDTSQILAMRLELVALRKQIDSMNPRDGKRLVLQRFLDESSTYTDSVPGESNFFKPNSEAGIDSDDVYPPNSNPFESPEYISKTSLTPPGLDYRSPRTKATQSIRSIRPKIEARKPDASNKSPISASRGEGAAWLPYYGAFYGIHSQRSPARETGRRGLQRRDTPLRATSDSSPLPQKILVAHDDRSNISDGVGLGINPNAETWPGPNEGESTFDRPRLGWTAPYRSSGKKKKYATLRRALGLDDSQYKDANSD